MGCTIGSSPDAPIWDSRKPLAFGSDKDVFMGTCRGRAAAICVAKRQGEFRLQQEVQVLEALGRHKHIVEMLYASTKPGNSYLALEAVEPLGFDLDRLVRQYLFATQSVPSQLAKRLIGQLCSALNHMHGHHIIHRDVKVENVLVTTGYDAKLIDMGIACEIGTREERWVWAPKVYFSPELCLGTGPQGTEVDTWGVGVVLHQIYQHRWDLIDASGDAVKMRPDRPSKQEPMEENLMEAMSGLLEFDADKRWSIKMCMRMISAEGGLGWRHSWGRLVGWDVSEGAVGWPAPVAGKAEIRKYLCQYKDTASPLTAYAAIVDGKSKHIVGKTVEELAFGTEYKTILLLVDVPANEVTKRTERFLEKTPKRDTVIEEGAWLYFGMPPSEYTEEAITSLKKAIFPQMTQQHAGRSTNSKVGLMAFSLDFDCFTFPFHIGRKAIVGRDMSGGGDPDVTQLNLRGNFGLNLAGIMRQKSTEPEWFPGPAAVVEPGDLGLVVRCPCRDGTTDPTMTDEELHPLMSKEEFEKIMQAAGTAGRC